MPSQVEKLTFLRKAGTVISGVCHGCGTRFEAAPDTCDQELIRHEIVSQFGNHICTPGQGRGPELLAKLKWLLVKQGRLSERLIKQTAGMPSLVTFHRHFGGFRRIYKLIGYNPRRKVFTGSNHRQHTYHLRTQLINQLKALFQGIISVQYSHWNTRPQVQLDPNVKISISICRSRPTRAGEPQWFFHPVPEDERKNLLLLGLLNRMNTKFAAYHLLPDASTPSKHAFKKGDTLLAAGIPLSNLADLYDAATRLLARNGEHNRSS
jgi:hypothetical protein